MPHVAFCWQHFKLKLPNQTEKYLTDSLAGLNTLPADKADSFRAVVQTEIRRRYELMHNFPTVINDLIKKKVEMEWRQWDGKAQRPDDWETIQSLEYTGTDWPETTWPRTLLNLRAENLGGDEDTKDDQEISTIVVPESVRTLKIKKNSGRLKRLQLHPNLRELSVKGGKLLFSPDLTQFNDLGSMTLDTYPGESTRHVQTGLQFGPNIRQVRMDSLLHTCDTCDWNKIFPNGAEHLQTLNFGFTHFNSCLGLRDLTRFKELRNVRLTDSYNFFSPYDYKHAENPVRLPSSVKRLEIPLTDYNVPASVLKDVPSLEELVVNFSGSWFESTDSIPKTVKRLVLRGLPDCTEIDLRRLTALTHVEVDLDNDKRPEIYIPPGVSLLICGYTVNCQN